MNLIDWFNRGWLTEHETSQREIADLLAVADRDLGDSHSPGLSADWKMAIAYNAALSLATLALAACGYRAERISHHYRVIQSLELTIGADVMMVDQLEQFRKKRNISDYERAGLVSDYEADTMRSLAIQLRELVVAWLTENRREPPGA
jgi:hypothetical protein